VGHVTDVVVKCVMSGMFSEVGHVMDVVVKWVMLWML